MERIEKYLIVLSDELDMVSKEESRKILRFSAGMSGGLAH